MCESFVSCCLQRSWVGRDLGCAQRGEGEKHAREAQFIKHTKSVLSHNKPASSMHIYSLKPAIHNYIVIQQLHLVSLSKRHPKNLARCASGFIACWCHKNTIHDIMTGHETIMYHAKRHILLAISFGLVTNYGTEPHYHPSENLFWHSPKESYGCLVNLFPWK